MSEDVGEGRGGGRGDVVKTKRCNGIIANFPREIMMGVPNREGVQLIITITLLRIRTH